MTTIGAVRDSEIVCSGEVVSTATVVLAITPLDVGSAPIGCHAFWLVFGLLHCETRVPRT
jgi:hypothetical protein